MKLWQKIKELFTSPKLHEQFEEMLALDEITNVDTVDVIPDIVESKPKRKPPVKKTSTSPKKSSRSKKK